MKVRFFTWMKGQESFKIRQDWQDEKTALETFKNKAYNLFLKWNLPYCFKELEDWTITKFNLWKFFKKEAKLRF